MKKVLVTGGAGFIGSNFIQYMLREEPEIELLVNLDLLTYAGNLENLLPVKDDKRYVFVHGDIRDRQLVEDIFARYGFDTVVHFAAESHVDRSILEPELFLTTNIIGTQTLLDAAKRISPGLDGRGVRRAGDGRHVHRNYAYRAEFSVLCVKGECRSCRARIPQHLRHACEHHALLQ